MCAEAWRDYEDLGVQIASAKKNRRSALDIRRLKKERRLAAGHYLGGLRALGALTSNNGDGKGLDLAAELAKQGLDT